MADALVLTPSEMFAMKHGVSQAVACEMMDDAATMAGGEPSVLAQAMDARVRFGAGGTPWVEGVDYTMLDRLNRPAEGQRAQGAESVVFKIRRNADTREYVLKMVLHKVGTVPHCLARIARENGGRPTTAEDKERVIAEIARLNTDEALLEELGGEWQQISRLLRERPHQNLAPVLHWYHSDKPSLAGKVRHRPRASPGAACAILQRASFRAGQARAPARTRGRGAHPSVALSCAGQIRLLH